MAFVISLRGAPPVLFNNTMNDLSDGIRVSCVLKPFIPPPWPIVSIRSAVLPKGISPMPQP